MPLSLALVFHFNQHTHEYAGIANRTCYRGLLAVLRAHPKLKFNLHFSGTLLRALPWFDVDTLALARAGLAAGQFELLGSTYAQNVPYASDDWDNARQIALHREVLAQLFDVKPSVFWLSERSWRQSLLPVIASGGYRVVPVEDHILRAAGLQDPAPASTTLGEQTLTVVYDDTTLRDRFNYAAWFGRRAQLFKYLQQLAASPGSENFLPVYAEDAEAMGQWGWEQGYLPQATWSHLDNLLTELEDSALYRLQHLSAARARQKLEALPDGAALWMDRALLRPDAPYHEDGFADWFDFLERSPKVMRFRRLYAVLRVRLQALQAARQDVGRAGGKSRPGGEFLRQAVEAFCHHQYEFGCIGVGGPGYWGWENARSAFTLAYAAELADQPRAGVWVDDVNGDGSDEQLFCNGRELAVLTSYGGRLLYWLDLAAGCSWVGNQLAVPHARFDVDAAKLPKLGLWPARWLPDAFAASAKSWNSLKHKEAAPTRMGRHLPTWLLDGEASEMTMVALPAAEGTPRQALGAQTGALDEVIQIDAAAPASSDSLLDFRFEDEGITYLLFPAPDIYIEKQVWQEPEAMRVRYLIDNRDEITHSVMLRSFHELAPDYAQALPAGRAAYAYYLHEARWPAVRNTLTGTAIVVETEPAAAAECHVNLLALRVEAALKCQVPPRSQAALEVRLRRAGAS